MGEPEIITNPRRKKQIEEFIDQDHAVTGEYYNIIEESQPVKKMILRMTMLIERDPDYYAPYMTLADLYQDLDEIEKSYELHKVAYRRAMHRIVDHKGNFPRFLEWGFLENRHIIRTISAWADISWVRQNNETALYLFRNLYRSNPNDNIGARYNILALRMELGPHFYEQFRDEEVGGISVMLQEKWFQENKKLFPEEFLLRDDEIEG